MAATGRAGGAVGMLRSLQLASKAAPRRRHDSIRSRYMVASATLRPLPRRGVGCPRDQRAWCFSGSVISVVSSIYNTTDGQRTLRLPFRGLASSTPRRASDRRRSADLSSPPPGEVRPQLTAPLAAGGGVCVIDFRANRGGLSTALLISLPCMATAARWP